MTVDVSIPYQAWSRQGDFSAIGAANTAIRETLAWVELPDALLSRKLEVSVVMANDDLLRTLNREYRRKDKPTNVLSFPQYEHFGEESSLPPESEPVCLGDILLSFETIRREASEKKIPLADHTIHLMIHGTLHLLGYDHESDEETESMQDTEISIMKKIGLKNPYD